MPAIAIDGPAAAGKSTIARRVAAQLGYVYVDTGALYRAIGLYVTRQGGDTRDEAFVQSCLGSIRLSLGYQQGEQRVFLDGEDVSAAIRLPEMSMAASNVSAQPAVRAFLLETQRRLAASQPVVMDGRDIGTVVLPDARVKIFLTASAEQRARRRYLEYQQKGVAVDYGQLLEETRQRDRQDTERAVAPLRQAEDAVLVDSTEMTLDEATCRILQIVKEKLGQ